MSDQFIFYGDEILPASQVHISPFDYGFLFGDGIFDTIKAEDGICEFLEDHLSRFRNSAAKLSLPVPDINFEEVISELLHKNKLTSGIARVKTIITRGVQPGLTMQITGPVTFMITAVPQQKRKPPETIGIYPIKRSDPVAEHKTLSYEFNLQAKTWASDNGFDDALLLDTDGRILECTSSNFFIERGQEILKPINRGYYLEGIMGKHFCSDREKDGFTIRKVDIRPEDITSEDTAYITNSMIGACKVRIQKTED